MSLFGPVFYFDLVRQTRRSLPAIMRLLYLLVLFFILGLADISRLPHHHGESLPPGEVARMVEEFCSIFLVLQFVLVVGLTPALTAGALTEEKEKQTMPFLLVSSLRNHEIVLGKLASRLVSILMIVIAGLPVFSLLQLLGGIDPNWLLAGFLGTGATLVSLAAVSIFWSTLLSRSRDAILLAYLSLPTYLLLARLLLLFASNYTGVLGTMVRAFNAGDPIRAFERSLNSLYARGDSLDEVLSEYLFFHGVVTISCLLIAVTQVRRAALREAGSSQGSILDRETRHVDDNPILWRERYIERGPRLFWLARGVLFILVALSFLPVILAYIVGGKFAIREREMNFWVRTVGTLVACLLLLAVGIRAACSITRERQKQTFDSLLTTPLELREILGGKWLGAMFGNQQGWCWLGSIAFLGICSGGLSVLAVPLLAICWFIQASFMASLGLYFSVRCRTTLQAIGATVTAAILSWFGPFFLVMTCCAFGGVRGDIVEKFLVGIVPPATLGMLAFSQMEFKDGFRIVGDLLFYVIVGQIIWTSFAGFLWGAIEQRFRTATGRNYSR